MPFASCQPFRIFPQVLKPWLLLLLLAAAPASYAQRPTTTPANAPAENSAAWLARVQLLPPAAQVEALRARLQADAGRTFRNDPSQIPVCLLGVSDASRAAWEAARRTAPDTLVHDARVLFALNGRLLNGSEAATALATVPTRAIRPLRFLTGATAQAIYGSRAQAGVVVANTR
jgi:hypothetical protein